MNQAMWADGITQSNLEALQHRRINIWGPASGEQACGEVGPGRMIEPQEIADRCAGMFETTRLTGKSAHHRRPDCEAIDPVRFLVTTAPERWHLLSLEAAGAGAQVELVSGPVHLPTPDRVRRTDVESAEQMLDAVMQRVAETDIFIGVAAVADYRPATIEKQKIKKTADQHDSGAGEEPDIISRVAALPDGPMVVGFAAETEQLEAHGREAEAQEAWIYYLPIRLQKPSTAMRSQSLHLQG